jgi:hypothetical protein
MYAARVDRGVNMRPAPWYLLVIAAAFIWRSEACAQPKAALLPAVLDTVRLQADTLQSLFIWVARSIRYDKSTIPSGPGPGTSEEVINEALTNRSGVCEHFAELFAGSARILGYQAHVIHGYANTDPSEGHAWVTIRTKNGWREFDPTWGAGYMTDSVYHPHLDLKWCNVPSDTMRKSHTALEPVWSKTRESIAAQDSIIAEYFSMDTLHRAKADMAYLEQLEPHPIVKEYKEYVMQVVAVFTWKKGVEQLNEAVAALNAFIDRKNHYFRKPRWDDGTIARNSSELVRLAGIACSTLAEVDTLQIEDPGLFRNAVDQAATVDQMAQHERAVAERYLNTWRPIRPSVLW